MGEMRIARSTVLLASLANTALAAQERTTFGSAYRVVSFTAEQGLPSHAITDIAQGEDGYLWIATGGILTRFDGYTFREYSGKRTPALKRRVSTLLVGRGDTLWIHDEGNAVLALHGEQVTEVVPPSARSQFALAQDATGDLLGIHHSAWSLMRRARPELPIRVNLEAMAHRRPFVPRDREGRIWLSGEADQIYVIGAEGVDSARRSADAQLVTSRSRGEVLLIRARVGSDIRDVIDANGVSLVSYRHRPGATAHLLDRLGRLWVTTSDAAEVYTPLATEPLARFAGLGQSQVSFMIEERSGCIWLAGRGLRLVCPIAFRTFGESTGLGSNQVHVISPGPAGSVLAHDAMGNTAQISLSGVGRVVRGPEVSRGGEAAFTDRQGTVWWSGPIEVVGRRTNGRLIRLPLRAVYRFGEGERRGGALWMAAHGQLYRVDAYSTDGARVTDSVTISGGVNHLSVGPDGVVWALILSPDLKSTLLRVSAGEATRFGTGEGLPNSALRSTLVDNDGTVWIGTYGSGLIRFRDGKFRAVGAESGLAEDVVTSILPDDAGNLWMGGNRSIHRVSRREVEDFFDGKVRRVYGVSYRRDDGLANPETSGWSGTRDSKGNLWFPTFGGAAVVDPRLAVALDSGPPAVHVLEIRSELDTIAAEAGAVPPRLSLGARRIEVEYTGISLRNSAGVRYVFRLDGVDADWIDAGTRRIASYNAIGPGSHTFRVRAVSAGGVWSAPEAQLRFVVPAYFHERLVFYVLLTVAFGGLCWWAFAYRLRALRRRENELTLKVEERTAKLGLALQTVAQQADQLRVIDEAKSRFFANVSHEFRTPLSLIIGPVEDLRDGRSGELPAAAGKRLEGVLGHARRLVQLVEQLLDVARLESGRLHLSAEVHDLVPLLRRLADSFASLAERKGILFRLSCPVGGVRVRYDGDQMEKVISNLVGNALKFTPSGGQVELRVHIDTEGDGWAVFEVEDTGPGISVDNQGRVFERFFQVDDSSRRAHEGVGIGLALAKELVELHGGVISLRSEEGVGSTFSVRLPIATGGKSHSGEEKIPSQATAPLNGQFGASARASGRAESDDVTTVLVVEDNADLLEFLGDHLSERFRVLMALNGVRGLEMARDHVPDLIISDVMMPEMDGQSLCEAVKGDPDIDFIPVILLTAKASRDSRLAGLAGGADDYLTKPVDLPELLIRADNLIASRRRVRERYVAEDRRLPTIGLPIRKAPRDASAQAMLDRFHATVSQHLADDDFQVDAMAVAMGMGRSTMYRKLEPLLGKSPMEVLWEYRLAQAAQWLAETGVTVSEVAYGVGFKSVPHFCTKFRERYHETPTQYRRARRGP